MAKARTKRAKTIKSVEAWGYVQRFGRVPTLCQAVWFTRKACRKDMSTCDRFGDPKPPPAENIVKVRIVPISTKPKARR